MQRRIGFCLLLAFLTAANTKTGRVAFAFNPNTKIPKKTTSEVAQVGFCQRFTFLGKVNTKPPKGINSGGIGRTSLSFYVLRRTKYENWSAALSQGNDLRWRSSTNTFASLRELNTKAGRASSSSHLLKRTKTSKDTISGSPDWALFSFNLLRMTKYKKSKGSHLRWHKSSFVLLPSQKNLIRQLPREPSFMTQIDFRSLLRRTK